MLPYKNILEASDFYFNAIFYNRYTISIGNFLLKKYEENSLLFDANAKKVIIELAKGINNGIEGINKIS